MKQHKKIIQTLLLSAASLFLLSNEVFSTAQLALKERGIVTDKETAKKMAKSPELIQEYKEHAQTQGVSPQEYTSAREQHPAPLPARDVMDMDALTKQFQTLHIAAPDANDKAAGKKLRELGLRNFTDQELEIAVKWITLGNDIAHFTANHMTAAKQLITLTAGHGGVANPAALTTPLFTLGKKLVDLGKAAFTEQEIGGAQRLLTLGGAIGVNSVADINVDNLKVAAKLFTISAAAPNFTQPEFEAGTHLVVTLGKDVGTLRQRAVATVTRMLTLGGGIGIHNMNDITGPLFDLAYKITGSVGGRLNRNPLDQDDFLLGQQLITLGHAINVNSAADITLNQIAGGRRVMALRGINANAVTAELVKASARLIAIDHRAGGGNAVAKAGAITGNDLTLAARLVNQGFDAFSMDNWEVADQIAVGLGHGRGGITTAQMNAGIQVYTVRAGLGVANAAGITQPHLDATTLLQTSQHGANAIAQPSALQITAVMEASVIANAAANPGVGGIGVAVAWAIQHGFGTQGPGSIPRAAAIYDNKGGNYRECVIRWPANPVGLGLTAQARLNRGGLMVGTLNRFYILDAEIGGHGVGMPFGGANNAIVIIHDLTNSGTNNYVILDGAVAP